MLADLHGIFSLSFCLLFIAVACNNSCLSTATPLPFTLLSNFSQQQYVFFCVCKFTLSNVSTFQMSTHLQR
eukprot:m.55578 g.55578  ORF g.55578 m.55578 type:complete len:71 (+) comp18647_c0_seq2:116-328(+)